MRPKFSHGQRRHLRLIADSGLSLRRKLKLEYLTNFRRMFKEVFGQNAIYALHQKERHGIPRIRIRPL